jgi:hypothetical protein
MAFGLAVALLTTSCTRVPLPFFRTQAQVILALLVLAGLDQARLENGSWRLWTLVVGAIAAYASSVSWGLGLPRIGKGSSILIVLLTAAWLAMASMSSDTTIWASSAASRLASGLLLGSTLTAMLLGHHYLTAPTMSINELERAVVILAVALLVRLALAGFSLSVLDAETDPLATVGGSADTRILLAARYGMGFLGTAIATYMTWKTARIRSTQSATGILYITMIFVLFGELTSMILTGRSGVIL